MYNSKSLHDAVYSSDNPTENRLKTELCSIRKSLEKGQTQCVKWVNSKDQLADCLTKEAASREKLYVLNGRTKLFIQYYLLCICKKYIYIKKIVKIDNNIEFETAAAAAKKIMIIIKNKKQ